MLFTFLVSEFPCLGWLVNLNLLCFVALLFGFGTGYLRWLFIVGLVFVLLMLLFLSLRFACDFDLLVGRMVCLDGVELFVFPEVGLLFGLFELYLYCCVVLLFDLIWVVV